MRSGNWRTYHAVAMKQLYTADCGPIGSFVKQPFKLSGVRWNGDDLCMTYSFWPVDSLACTLPTATSAGFGRAIGHTRLCLFSLRTASSASSALITQPNARSIMVRADSWKLASSHVSTQSETTMQAKSRV